MINLIKKYNEQRRNLEKDYEKNISEIKQLNELIHIFDKLKEIFDKYDAVMFDGFDKEASRDRNININYQITRLKELLTPKLYSYKIYNEYSNCVEINFMLERKIYSDINDAFNKIFLIRKSGDFLELMTYIEKLLEKDTLIKKTKQELESKISVLEHEYEKKVYDLLVD